MSTTAGIAAASVAISAQNSAELSRIKKEQCVLYVERYESQGAAVAEMKQYAECVETLNPDPMPDGGIVLAKACVITLMLIAVIGLAFGTFRGRQTAGDRLCAMFLYPLLAAALILFVALFWLGAKFVIGG